MTLVQLTLPFETRVWTVLLCAKEIDVTVSSGLESFDVRILTSFLAGKVSQAITTLHQHEYDFIDRRSSYVAPDTKQDTRDRQLERKIDSSG